MNYNKDKQNTLQVSSYDSYRRVLEKKFGKKFRELLIIPPTFMYGKRKMNKLFQDALTIFHNTGPPQIFLTFTTNLEWKEITDNLYPGVEASEDVFLVNRVFHAKMKSLLEYIDVHDIFGRMQAFFSC